MICPYCNKEMTKGYFNERRIGFSVRWYPMFPKGMSITSAYKESVKLSSMWKNPCVAAYRCAECKKIVIDENNTKI